MEPAGRWLTWLVLAGRGFGKTKMGAETIRSWVETEISGRIAIIADTAADARDVMVDGPSGLLAVSPPWNRPKYEPSKRRLTWPNGAIATLFSAEDPEQLRGPQFDAAWVDELAKYAYAQEVWDQLQFSVRLGEWPRKIVTTTPRPIPLIKRLVQDGTVHVTRGRTLDNAANLAPPVLKDITERYAGTRLGRQELEAEILDDVPGALWTYSMIETARLMEAVLPDMARVIVAVDPSGTDGERGDQVGIVVSGKGVDGRAYVLADRSCRLSPDGWARRAVDAYREFKADRIVAERNFGGAMVESVLRTVDRSVAYQEVTASRGKAIRAEPVAALYEQGRVSHVAGLTAMEDQMCLMTRDGYQGEGSPDRVDALVWGLTELMLGDAFSVPDYIKAYGS